MKTELIELHRKNEQLHDSLFSVISILNKTRTKVTDSTVTRDLEKEIDSLWNISDRNDIEQLKATISYFKSNASCVYCFDQILQQVNRQPGKNLYQEFEVVYSIAPEELQKSKAGLKMNRNLKLFKQSMVGSNAPIFQGLDFSDQQISISDFRDKKYILLDFWASWCAPCIGEIPFLKSIYQKYSNDDLEIISISLDENISDWKKAVVKENI